MPTQTEIALPDGTRIVERVWAADGDVPNVGSLLLVHGLGEHAGRYDHVAAVVAALGVEVRSWDQRGFGRSGGARATLPHPDALLDDAAWMFDRLVATRRAAGDGAPPFVLGHSMGGAIVARAVTGGRIAPRGMILSSPALVPRLSAPDRWAAAVGRRVMPHLRVPSRVPRGLLSHDPAVEAALAVDPGAHDRVTPRLVAFMVDAGRQALEDAPHCRVPTLLQVAGDDLLVDPAGAVRFHERLPAGLGTLRVYDALYHEIYNERVDDRAAVLADLAAWLRAQLDAPAGGAQVRSAGAASRPAAR